MFSFFVFFYPNVLGHSDNYIPANPLSTPAHIVPEWYFLPFYAILRSIPDKLGGVVAMISAILVLLLLPIINTSKIRSSKFRPIFGIAYWFLVSDFIILGWIGQKPVESPYIEIGIFATFFYFFFLLVLVPVIGLLENYLVKNNDGICLVEEIDEEKMMYFGHIPEDPYIAEDLYLLDEHPRLFFVDDLRPHYFSKYTKVIFYK
jgi:quinol-cytochrome oxidoreductase complex cytochrome b subunit